MPCYRKAAQMAAFSQHAAENHNRVGGTKRKGSDVDGAYGDSQEGMQRRGVLAWPCYSATPLACVGESRVALDCLSSGWKGACKILTKHQTVT
jgi:hypothetical protein